MVGFSMPVNIAARPVNLIENLDLKVSPVFVLNQRAMKAEGVRFVVNQGGTRSGKTYSILQVIMIYCLTNRGKVVDIIRKTHAELTDTVVKDWEDILTAAGLLGICKINKTKLTYRLNGNTVRFLGMDKAQKKRGSKRDICYINEANGVTLEDWIQLDIRTADRMYIDFNPSEYFWVNDQILEKPNEDDNKFILIKSNYKDNYDFLTYKQIKRIEKLIEIDDFWYQVYTLGNLAVMKGKIYEKQNLIEPEEYDVIDYDELYYGLDFGYEHHTALIECKYGQEKTYERQRYFERHKTDEQLIEWMLANDISMSAPIYADPAYPASIRKISDAGFNVRRAKKDIIDGIRYCQGFTPNICKSSVDYIRHRNAYKWRQKADGSVIEGEPVKINDDLLDASRYAHYTHRKRLGG